MFVFQDKHRLQMHLKTIGKGEQIGLVPTMGALHQGHAALIKTAIYQNDVVVVSIFVNPTQFNNPQDLLKYPKTLEKDIDLLQNLSENIVLFHPEVSEIYNDEVMATTYNFDGLDEVMEGTFRKNHFNGVGTIVEKLFRLIQPHKAYFGEKDFQQLKIIQKMVALRQLPTQVIGCPIVRERSGLAMSSRNQRLSKEDKDEAAFIYRILCEAKEKFSTESASEVIDWVTRAFQTKPKLQLEYIEIRDEATLAPCRRKHKTKKYRVFIAVYVADVRLIDNIAL
ncbi:pantoate--beta-alanine ligase [Arenibacter sp. GZD96]|uniref:pantoate--beta-alanine ligase n=1 Tax=Aurantibrevibacter litoralis TaxID=3106030 RepID=UPI002AFF18CA|nr:pantoate--beta-alanine ligase [Arenibacter sp. GZD-96]MEA1785643.1 pantoate--beta-alanine ligase [Arenibacter sp. GZD-96]